MTVTITATNGAGSSAPITVVAPYDTGWRSRNIVHELVGGGIAVALSPPRPRAGQIQLLYATESDAFDCALLHEQITSFVLTESDRPHMDMTYVTDGDVRVTLNEQTDQWTVTVGYQEVES